MIRIVRSLVVAVLCAAFVCMSAMSSDNSVSGLKEHPAIIWFHNAGSTKPDSLKKSLSNGIITHVLILYHNSKDAPLAGQPEVVEAVKICKEYDVKIIWCRTLWPSYDVKDFRRAYLFDPNYYETIIERVRNETKILNADYTAIDTEAYGYFPYKLEFQNPIKEDDFKAMQDAIDTAVAAKGQVDLVLPAAYPVWNHVCNAEIRLGRLKIAEHTYFNIPGASKNPRRPFDIFGAYVNTTTRNEKYPDRPYFTPREILERQDLWGHKKGLMLYPREDNVTNVAALLSEINYVEPNIPTK